MADIPIIMSGPMVRATLREIEKPGTGKTETRRLAWGYPDPKKNPQGARLLAELRAQGLHDAERRRSLRPSPWQRVKPGDRLWVRETWKPHSLYAGMKPRDVPRSKVFYAADISYAPSNTPWVPSIYLPRWASRLTLIVGATKIERLHDISEADCFAEGVEGWIEIEATGERKPFGPAALMNFGALWSRLHGPESWHANPEVVALTFRPVLANIDAPEAQAA
jgi:hypothetical protein